VKKEKKGDDESKTNLWVGDQSLAEKKKRKELECSGNAFMGP